MSKYASKVVAQAKAWLGCNENDGSFRKIIDTYNAHKPLARGYKVKYSDEWCATFVSAVAIALGYTDIIPTECGCGEMVKLLQKLGAWDENDGRKPNPGDLVLYDWQAPATGDATGWPDHVGIVEKVDGSTITVIEGNYSKSVKRRTIQVNDKRIRGYGVPKYDKEPAPVVPTPSATTGAVCSVALPVLRFQDKGDCVGALQALLIGKGYDLGKYGPKRNGIDEHFGLATENAVEAFQEDTKLEVNGVCGPKTWAKLLGV